jgi:hypothetical protein
MIHRVNNCFGVPLWKSKRRFVELWFCFSAVMPHTHPGQHVEIIPLFGWSTFSRAEPDNWTGRFKAAQALRISPRKWFRGFSVPAGWLHWFTGAPLVFLNITNTAQSAAENLVYS